MIVNLILAVAVEIVLFIILEGSWIRWLWFGTAVLSYIVALLEEHEIRNDIKSQKKITKALTDYVLAKEGKMKNE